MKKNQKNLLVVIDMVNGFVNFGALADKNINNITPNIINIIKKAKEKNYEIIAFKDCHKENDEEFKVFPRHCIEGTKESELIPELNGKGYFDKEINKNTTNGFITKEFQNLIDKNIYENVIVCGCCTDICVKNFVESYLNFIKQNKLQTKIIVVENACQTFDSEIHIAGTEHKNAIIDMSKMGAKIVKIKEKKEIKKTDSEMLL